MPTVSVKRDLLFQALGRTYRVRCRARKLGWAEVASRNQLYGDCRCIIRPLSGPARHSFRDSSCCMPSTDFDVGTQNRKDALSCITSLGSSVEPD
ncbi:hypothetical protein STEG23_009695 [Scotinomys teguina]